MRNSILLCLFVLLLHYDSRSQSVAINTDGSQPNSSALLDLKSDSKGLLLPRMTMQQRTSIPAPATGLLVYQTDIPQGFYYNKGTGAAPDWVLLGTTTPAGSGIANSAFKAGAAPYPSSTMAFISDPVIITITAGQTVYVNSSRAMGGYAAASNLGIHPACQSTEAGSPLQTLGLGIYGLQVPANTRITFSINGIFKDLPPGTYKFGMAGISSSPNWTNSEWSYTSVLVY